jgi:soluble lytic murein transglycosylase-like protein
MSLTQDKVTAAADKYGIPSDLLLTLAQTESGFNQGARSPAGAVGVMQLMPSTAAGLGVDPYNEDQNIDGGARYLASLYNQFGSWELAAAAYNAGPGTIQKVLDGVKALPTETANYVQKIFGIDLMSWLSSSDSTSPTTDEASTDGFPLNDIGMWIAVGVGLLGLGYLALHV